CFFSSRRRHTRSKRDWSSDVCSSDLIPVNHSAQQGTVYIRVHISQNTEHLIVGKLLSDMKGNALVQKTQCIPHGTVRRFRNVADGPLLYFHLFFFHQFIQTCCNRINRNSSDIIYLAPFQVSHRKI